MLEVLECRPTFSVGGVVGLVAAHVVGTGGLRFVLVIAVAAGLAVVTVCYVVAMRPAISSIRVLVGSSFASAGVAASAANRCIVALLGVLLSFGRQCCKFFLHVGKLFD